MSNPITQASYEAEHGAGTFEEGDINDLYAVEKEDINRTLPRPLDTISKANYRKQSRSAFDLP